jgi:4-hydroxybenzoate polyprenyltransferase
MSFNPRQGNHQSPFMLTLPVGALFATGSAIIVLRMLLEDLVEPPQLLSLGLSFYENVVDIGHVFLCWWILILVIVLLLSLILRRQFLNVFSLAVISLPVILIVPFLDMLIPAKGVSGIHYQHTFSTLSHIAANLINPFITLGGITPGVRVEIFLIILSILFTAHFLLEKSWAKSMLASGLTLIVIMIFGYLPAFYRFAGVKEFQSTFSPGPFAYMRMLFIPLLFLFAGITLRLAHEQPGGWKLLRKIVYPSRMTAYGGAFLAGYLLIHLGSATTATDLSPAMEILRVVTALSGIWFLFLSAKFRNDIIDLPADRISTPDRPLVTGEMSVRTASQLSGIFIVISFPLLIQGSPNLLLFWLVFCAISHLYVSEHLNVRKIYPLGQAAIAALIVFLVLAGAELAVEDGASLAFEFHPLFIPGVFLMAFLVANLKDFRDLEGDRIAGYRSLPMLFENPLRAVPWLITGTAIIVSILSFSVGVPMIPVGGILLIYLFSGFRTLKRISGFHEMDKITVLTIWTILACLAAFVLNHLFPM